MSNSKPEEPTALTYTMEELQSIASRLDAIGLGAFPSAPDSYTIEAHGLPNDWLPILEKVERFALIEAEAAAMRTAMENARMDISYSNDDTPIHVQDQMDSARRTLDAALRSTTTGQALLDRIKALEEENANLRTALTPFATWADTAEWYLSNRADTARVVTAYAKEGGLYVINVGNLRSARTALKEDGANVEQHDAP